MELANIEKLIEKYLEGTTTLQEENSLKNYFTSSEIATHLQEYEALFTYFSIAKKEQSTQPLKLTTKNLKRRNFKWASIAASIALLFFVGNHEYKKYQVEKQFASLTKGLKLLSKNLQKGEQAIANVTAYEDAVNRMLK